MKKRFVYIAKIGLTVFAFVLMMMLGVYIGVNAWSDPAKDLEIVGEEDVLTATRWNEVVNRATHIYRDNTKGVLEIDGGLQLGGAGSSCAAGLAGTMIYSGGAVMSCNGTDWE